MGKTLGIILIAGGLLVGAVIVWVGSVYLGEGSLSRGAVNVGVAVGFILLVLPQIGFGIFLWAKGVLYSTEARPLRKMGHCAHCHGELQLADKGINQCPHCGTDYFLE
jgi:hypothetical protein